MDVLLDRDRSSRLVCTLDAGERKVVVTASDARSASADLLAALDEVRETGYGECLWREAAGEYRWIFRRTGERLTVVALWSSGTLTGWEHVLQADTDFEALVAQMRSGLAEAAG